MAFIRHDLAVWMATTIPMRFGKQGATGQSGILNIMSIASSQNVQTPKTKLNKERFSKIHWSKVVVIAVTLTVLHLNQGKSLLIMWL